MIHENIWQDPKTGEQLHFSKNGRLLVSDNNKARYQINDKGIIEFIEDSDIKGSNAKSTEFYNSFSPFYELGQKAYYSFLGGEKKARNDYLKYLHINDGDRVLEVSVGTGANVKFLSRGANFYGLDISKGQLMQSVINKMQYGLPLNLCWANAESLPFRDNCFDCVYHIGGINLFNNKKKAIDEMIRVAKPGTYLMIADETEKVSKKYQHLPYFGKPFKNRSELIKAPVDLLPENVDDINSVEIRDGTLYVLTFRKKA